ncbi:MAG: methionyl-tRNA formyltransferase, partial [bacterium]
VPGAWTLLHDDPVKLYSPRVVEPPASGSGEPGRILAASSEEGLVVATGEGGAVAVDEVQPAGKRRMAAAAWLRGSGPSRGERFL